MIENANWQISDLEECTPLHAGGEHCAGYGSRGKRRVRDNLNYLPRHRAVSESALCSGIRWSQSFGASDLGQGVFAKTQTGLGTVQTVGWMWRKML